MQDSNYKVYKHDHSQGLVVLFEIEVKLVRRYISPKCEYDHLEIERTICRHIVAYSEVMSI
jgi:hypothetical protein